MSTIINATTTNGVVIQPDNSGSLVLQTNSGTTALTIDTAQRAAFVAGTAALPAITTSGDTDTGIFFPAADTIAFTEGGTEAMRIDAGGRLLVNRTTTLGSQYIQVTNTLSSIAAERTGSNGPVVIFYDDGTDVGSIDVAGTSTSYTTSSDYRLKENIAPMTGALDKVAQLNPVTYTWKIDGSNGQGFIAHELAEVVPDCVTGDKDAVDEEGNPVYQGVDTSFLVATLTSAIQEMKAIIDAQSARITALENK
jgi:hypothetical protein